MFCFYILSHWALSTFDVCFEICMVDFKIGVFCTRSNPINHLYWIVVYLYICIVLSFYFSNVLYKWNSTKEDENTIYLDPVIISRLLARLVGNAIFFLYICLKVKGANVWILNVQNLAIEIGRNLAQLWRLVLALWF